MAYNVDTRSFGTLAARLDELPGGLPLDPRPLRDVLFAYHRVFADLLTLAMAIMRACIERNDKRRYVRNDELDV